VVEVNQLIRDSRKNAFCSATVAKFETVGNMLWKCGVTNKAEQSVCGTMLEFHGPRPGRERCVGRKSWDRISSTKGEVQIIT
jgi:hypothetical protein